MPANPDSGDERADLVADAEKRVIAARLRMLSDLRTTLQQTPDGNTASMVMVLAGIVDTMLGYMMLDTQQLYLANHLGARHG